MFFEGIIIERWAWHLSFYIISSQLTLIDITAQLRATSKEISQLFFPYSNQMDRN